MGKEGGKMFRILYLCLLTSLWTGWWEQTWLNCNSEAWLMLEHSLRNTNASTCKPLNTSCYLFIIYNGFVVAFGNTLFQSTRQWRDMVKPGLKVCVTGDQTLTIWQAWGVLLSTATCLLEIEEQAPLQIVWEKTCGLKVLWNTDS